MTTGKAPAPTWQPTIAATPYRVAQLPDNGDFA
jgi:hypothetical protein